MVTVMGLLERADVIAIPHRICVGCLASKGTTPHHQAVAVNVLFWNLL